VTIAALAPTLARLADQADAVAAAYQGPAPARDEIPAHQRAAWFRVLASFAKAETLEEEFLAPALASAEASGLGHPDVLRFFRGQAHDEERHLAMLRAYMEAHYGSSTTRTGWLTATLYDHVMGTFSRRGRKQPLMLLLPIYMLEKIGTIYLSRLARCAAEAGCPALQALLQDIHRDEARHVAGIGAACRALREAYPLGRLDRAILVAIARLLVLDMDRTAWWKRGLRAHMAAIALDGPAMNRDVEAVYHEIRALLDGDDRHAAA
jgi:rubrerythrin